MVLLHVKRGEQEFLLEASLTAPAAEAARAAAELHALQARIQRACAEGARLLAPPLCPATDQGVDSDEEDAPAEADAAGAKVVSQTAAEPDGAPGLQQLSSALASVAAAVSNERAARREVLTLAAAQAAADELHSALASSFPSGLPAEWQSVQAALVGSGGGGCAASAALHGEVTPDEAVLYFAGKALAADRPLSERLGRNDKCRAVVRLQERGAGAPPREAQLDKEGELAMLQWWHKRQEAQREAAQAGQEVSAALDSAEWTDPRALKACFTGISAIRLR